MRSAEVAARGDSALTENMEDPSCCSQILGLWLHGPQGRVSASSKAGRRCNLMAWLARGSTLIEQVLLEALHQHVAVGLQLGTYGARPGGWKAQLGHPQRREPCCDRHLQILQRHLPAPLLLRRQSHGGVKRHVTYMQASLTTGDIELP